MRNGITDDNTKCNHAPESKNPLRNGNCDKAAFPKAMLQRSLVRIRTAQFGVDHDQTDCPVYSDRENNEQDYTHQHTGLSKCVWLSYDPRPYYTICHVHEGHPHSTPRPSIFQMLFGEEIVGGRKRHTGGFYVGEKGNHRSSATRSR